MRVPGTVVTYTPAEDEPAQVRAGCAAASQALPVGSSLPALPTPWHATPCQLPASPRSLRPRFGRARAPPAALHISRPGPPPPAAPCRPPWAPS